MWENITSGVPHGPNLRPLLFHLFLCNLFDLFLEHENFGYATMEMTRFPMFLETIKPKN